MGIGVDKKWGSTVQIRWNIQENGIPKLGTPNHKLTIG